MLSTSLFGYGIKLKDSVGARYNLFSSAERSTAQTCVFAKPSESCEQSHHTSSPSALPTRTAGWQMWGNEANETLAQSMYALDKALRHFHAKGTCNYKLKLMDKECIIQN